MFSLTENCSINLNLNKFFQFCIKNDVETNTSVCILYKHVDTDKQSLCLYTRSTHILKNTRKKQKVQASA